MRFFLIVASLVMLASPALGFQLIGSGADSGGAAFTGTFYSTMDSASAITSPDTGTGGDTTGDETYATGAVDTAFTKGSATTSGFSIPSSNLDTDEFTIEFVFIPSHDSSNTTVYSGWVNLVDIDYGSDNSILIRGNNGGSSTQWSWEFRLIDDSPSVHTLASGFSTDLAFSAGDEIKLTFTADSATGDLGIAVDSDNDGTDDYTYSLDDSAYTMGTSWYGTNIDFFKAQTHTSQVDELKIWDSLQ